MNLLLFLLSSLFLCSELSVQHCWGQMWALQGRLLWQRRVADMQSVPVPIQRIREQVSEMKYWKKPERLASSRLNTQFDSIVFIVSSV